MLDTVVSADVSLVHTAAPTYAAGTAAADGAAAAARNRAKQVHYAGAVAGRLSVTLCKGNGRMYRESLVTLARASGRAFQKPACAGGE
jgi:hypothetical protein